MSEYKNEESPLASRGHLNSPDIKLNTRRITTDSNRVTIHPRIGFR